MQLRSRLARKWQKLRIAANNFAPAEPISREFGFDRGTPVDRYYIENFLRANAGRIRGRTLEIGDDSYTRRFGGAATEREVLHVTPGYPGATYHGDLTNGVLPDDAFDCAVLTQTLHLIYDMPAAVAALHSALKPGGTLLVTVPGISQIAADEWGETWYWSLTSQSLRRLLGDSFGPANVAVEAFGNVYAATAFLQGLATEELRPAKLDVRDPLYPVTVTGIATKALAPAPA